ncbi:phosphoethanolamine--lipid A transferase [Pigmentiphaga soli]|uniref:Phosphoethanolamine--lipid A transferase n=2 Tax=Pigmentiphaga soli TaxID=1007095 RepID=A0ABP8GJN8_9BURK
MLAALALVAFYNVPAWRALARLVPLAGLGDAAFYVSFGVLMWAAFALLLTAVSFRWIFKPVLMLIAIASALAAYFMTDYGVSIDSVMIQNMAETNLAEASALFSPAMLGYLLVLGLLPTALVWRLPVAYARGWKGLAGRAGTVLACAMAGILMLAAFYGVYSPLLRQNRALTNFINPTSYLHALDKYAHQRWGVKETLAVAPIGLDARPGPAWARQPRKSLVVFVVGETARADHFGLNGYARDTTPELRRLGVLNFGRVSSCGTSTAVSVPCMFSGFPRADYSDRKAKTHEGLLDVLQRAGVEVFWRDNNSDCKGACLRVPHDTVDARRNDARCDGETCYDEVMLDGLQQYIDAKQDNVFIVLHSIGSHGPAYYRRYPAAFQKFSPVCRSNQFSQCTHEELINAYDNTIAYTDHFLAQVVALLQRNAAQRDTAMVYVSDHGESLGENGLYLHAAPYAIAPEAQTHVPMVMWLSPEAQRDWGIDRRCLAARGDAPFSHDNVFHTFLGLFDVQTALYRPALDMAAPCRDLPEGPASAVAPSAAPPAPRKS